MSDESKIAGTYEKATSAIKFTDEELKQLKDIQQKYVEVQGKFGAVAVSRLRIEQQVAEMNQYSDNLRKEYTENQDAETKFLDDITKKYGEGSLDLDTGTFLPNEPNKVK